MTNDNHNHDGSDDSISATTRRGLLGALGVAGLASLGSSGASAQLGGGPEADAMSEYRVPTYRVPESDLDSPGVIGREVTITEGGSNWAAGDQLVDTGEQWVLRDSGVGSLSAGASFNTDNPATVRVFKSGGTVYAHTRSAELASGSASSVVQSATDHLKSNGGGKLSVAAGSYVFDSVVAHYNGIEQSGTPLEDVTIEGEGDGATDFQIADETETNLFYLEDPKNVTFHDIGTDGNASNQSSTTSDTHQGIRLRKPNNVRIENCGFRNHENSGVWTAGNINNGPMSILVVDDCSFVNCSQSQNFEGAYHTKSAYTKVTNCYFDENPHAILVELANQKITGNTIEGSTIAAIRFNNASNDGKSIVQNNQLNHNAGNAVIIVDNSRGVHIIDNHILANSSGLPVYLTGGYKCVISGNMTEAQNNPHVKLESDTDNCEGNLIHDNQFAVQGGGTASADEVDANCDYNYVWDNAAYSSTVTPSLQGTNSANTPPNAIDLSKWS